MGVNGLFEYMCEKANNDVIRDTISISKEIQQWKSTKKVPPKILIDIKEFIHTGVQRDNMGQLLGGRYSLNLLYFRHFFTVLKKADVKLIFFTAAKTLSDDLSLFIPNREAEYIKHIKMMDDIDASGGDVETYMTRFSGEIKAPHAMEANLHKVAREFGEVHTNYFRHNQEIAQYALQHRSSILAIITNDTDFMVFDGDFQFWRANDIDLKVLSVCRYRRDKLREHLQLNTQQLELLSAISGSVYLPTDVLTSFYAKIGISSHAEGRHIPRLAQYIRELTLSQSKNDCSLLEKIACDVFGDSYTSEDVNAIENGLIQYNLKFATRTPKALEFCKDHNMFVYKLLSDDVYLIRDINYIDYRNYRSKSYAELVIPLLRRAQGILNANERPRPKTRAFCIKRTHEKPYTLYNVPIDYPPIKVPEWFSVVFKIKDDKYDSVRWSLFDWVFRFEDKFNKFLENVPKTTFILVLITLKYLLQQEEITIDEADAILVTENYTRVVYKNRIPLIDLPKKINTHAIRIAHLYVKIYVLVRNCLETCGLFYYTSLDYIMFDGRYFHQTLEEISSSPEKKKEALRCIQKYRIYVD